MIGILNHMLWCIISIPVVSDFHVQESLALMEYHNIMEKANIFFLQELVLDLKPCLDSIQEINDFCVLALMELNLKAQRDKGLASWMVLIRQPCFPLDPIPPGVSWRRLSWQILWSCWRSGPCHPAFRTLLLWWPDYSASSLSKYGWCWTELAWRIEPSPTSLSDAMKCWTMVSIDQTILHTTFKACSNGLESEDGTAHGCDRPRTMSLVIKWEYTFQAWKLTLHPGRASSNLSSGMNRAI